jgi:hypothetical protein
LLALASCAILSLSDAARAEDSALAESLFRQGRALMDRGDFAAACPRLSESFAQDPSTGTLLALALCQERLGKTASAWASYVEVVSRARLEDREDRERAARERANALESTLSRLTIDVDPAAAAIPGLVVTRDGLAIGRGAWAASTPVDPGEHEVAASAPGKQSWSTTVTIGETSDLQTVTVPLLADLPASASPTPPAPATQLSAAPPPVIADSTTSDERPLFTGSPLQTVGLVVGGVGVVGLGVGAFFGLRASSLGSDSNSGGHL